MGLVFVRLGPHLLPKAEGLDWGKAAEVEKMIRYIGNFSLDGMNKREIKEKALNL